MQPAEQRFLFLPHVVAYATLIAAALAALALLGSTFGIEGLRELIPDTPQMTATASIGVILLSAAVWLVRDSGPSDHARAWSRLLAQLAALIGALTLIEYIFGVELGIDRVFDEAGAFGHPGRMSPHAAAALVCLGLWVSALDRDGRRWAAAISALAALSALIVLAAVIAWLYGADYVYGNTGTPGVAPQAMLALVALFAAILCCRTETPWMRLTLSGGAGGHSMRRLIPALVVVPILAGYAIVLGVSDDRFSVQVAAAFAIALTIALLLSILVFTSRELEHADLDRRRLERRLVELADSDPLTGVFNRRRLDDELARRFAIAQRNESPLAVLSIDLDELKAANDAYGRATGDELLIATAGVLREELRSGDFICRPGGDEFVVLLADTDHESARIVAGKLIRAFRGVERPRPGGGAIALRASIGIAVSDADAWTAPTDLLAAADGALYAAKQAGGNRLAADGVQLTSSSGRSGASF